MVTSFFTLDGDWFIPSEFARGPWDPTACHAGPPTGLLARASEHLLPDQQLVRITVNLIRPVPHARFRIESSVTRRGRTVSTTVMRLLDGSDREIINATGMHLTPSPEPLDVPTTPWTPPAFDESVPGDFAVVNTTHGLPWFGDAVEARYRPGEGPGIGPGLMWMRTLPLLDDEDPSPFQRICPLSDCGNAISRNANAVGDHGDFAFMNTDLTLMLHRPPDGDWFGSDSVSRWEPTGQGISDSQLFDVHGPVGRALQTLLIRPG